MSKKTNKVAPEPSADGQTPPSDILPLFLATKTQEIFQCVCDQHVTEESPFKLISKEHALEDMMMRAAISDFSPVKQIISNYPASEFLIVYDFEFKYGQNFYLCITEEAKERLLKPKKETADTGDEGSVAGGDASDTGEKMAEEDEVYIYKPTEPKEWISHGSHIDVDHERIIETRHLVKYRASRVRKYFGSPYKFTDRNAKVTCTGKLSSSYVGCKSFSDDNFKVQRLELDAAVQAVPTTSDSTAQTIWRDPVTAQVQTKPRTFDDQQIIEVEDKENYKEFLSNSIPKLELVLQQNNITNAFVNDWEKLGVESSDIGVKSDNHLKEYQSFTDLEYSKNKTVSYMDWHPEIKGVVGVSCCERLTAYERIEQGSRLFMNPSLILIWSFSDPIHPQILLRAPHDVACFKFCPTNPNIVAGGCMNGQIAMWDISDYHEKLVNARGSVRTNNSVQAMFGEEVPPDVPTIRYSAVSAIDLSHKSVISCIDWIPNHYEYNRTGQLIENKDEECHQLVTGGADGYVMVWDIQKQPSKNPGREVMEDVPLGVSTTFQHLNLRWKPVLKLNMPRGSSSCYTPVSMSLSERHGVSDHIEVEKGPSHDPKKGPPPAQPVKNVRTQFICGTEDGEVVFADLVPIKGEKNELNCRIERDFAVHGGPVNTIQRNPFFNDLILTVGGWKFNLYKEGVETAILSSACSSKLYTIGHWSLTRASVFFLATSEGDIEVWDLLDRTHEEILSQNVTSAIITKVVPCIITRKQHLLAVTDNIGTLHILEIPWNLHHPVTNEVNAVKEYIDREVNRIDFINMKKASYPRRESEPGEKEMHSVDSDDDKDHETLLKEEFDRYLGLEHKMLVKLGIIEEESEDN